VEHPFDARPVIVAIAGPNGAGKSTFYEAFVKPAGLRFVNADLIAKELGIDAYEAATLATRMREVLVAQRESFAFETVFSDPHGEKVDFLRDAATRGYCVVLCFIGLDSAHTSDERVAMRVLQGGHDVPPDKVQARYPRSLANLKRAMAVLPFVWVYDNSDLQQPFRKVAEIENGTIVKTCAPLPGWLALQDSKPV
jgi:predicted ABC-type ATPase